MRRSPRLAFCLLLAACGHPPSSTTSGSSGETSAGETSAGETGGEPTCPMGHVQIAPACDDGHDGTVLPPAGCQIPCDEVGAPCGDGLYCLPASTRTCACEGDTSCCPECRATTLLCLDRALFACDRYGDEASCEAAPGVWRPDDAGPEFCGWESVVAVVDAAACTFGEVHGECVQNTFVGDGCPVPWSCAPDLPHYVLVRGADEVMLYDECVGSTPEGWSVCTGPDAPDPRCACACAPDFPG
ncbi:MAG: hypothetical protein H6711_19845 [Myxococcales bacterium]|nr:hypothetical protein [Myxococcales bacterium]